MKYMLINDLLELSRKNPAMVVEISAGRDGGRRTLSNIRARKGRLIEAQSIIRADYTESDLERPEPTQ
jgi:hypothetical protein